ncbi:uncharacterized protein LOC131957301 isoform X2 [Physella acuta]|uniref:uncharacterized protein LOC131957301 isoform X2 n=1 Tax=Physella acuta TaxID=109671 RepID=UPI0027DD1147|nr:uncharacterized protein LOC131957301 isoform X2 [Physella acuta]
MPKPAIYTSTLEGSLEKLPVKMSGCKYFLHVLLFLFLLGNDAADFVSDWLFFVDVKIAGKGLVYGEPDQAAVWAMLAFSIIGTFTFFFEIVNLWWESFRRNPWIDSDVLSAVVIWIEDIPQIGISLYLATCREDPISVFQLTKAAVVLISIFIRIVVSLVKYCNRDAIRSHHHVKHKVVIMFGVILEACCAVAIFFLTQTERGSEGNVAFRVPTTVLEDRYNDNRYFSNVSVFITHPTYFNLGDPDTTDHVFNFIRLASIYKIRSSYRSEFSCSIQYEKSPTEVKMALWEKHASETNPTGSWSLVECYTINQNGAATELVNTTCVNAFTSNSVELFIKFKFYQPTDLFRKQVFGDILFNMKTKNNGCTAIDSYSTELSNSGKDGFLMHYFRTNSTLQPVDSKFLQHDSGTTARLFRNDGLDLTDVRQVWKTGWNQCESTGHMGPTLDASVGVECQR